MDAAPGFPFVLPDETPLTAEQQRYCELTEVIFSSVEAEDELVVPSAGPPS